MVGKKALGRKDVISWHDFIYKLRTVHKVHKVLKYTALFFAILIIK